MKKVLLVEDDHTLRVLLKTLLELENYSVIIIGDSSIKEINNSIHEINPDFIILDVHLRQANGIDILEKIRQDGSLDQVKIIISSGADYKEQCMQTGANGYLLKPYMPDELLQLLKTI